MEDERRNVIATEVHDVLGGAFQFEHLVVTSGFESTRFKLVADLDLLVIFAFIVKVVLEFNNQFNCLTQAVNHQFLSTEGLDLGNLEPFFLLSEFSENVLLLALEFDFFNLGFLLFLWCENLRQIALFSVTLRSGCDD